MRSLLRFLILAGFFLGFPAATASAIVTVPEQEPQNNLCPGQRVESGTLVSPASFDNHDEDNYVFWAQAGTAITVGIQDPDGANFQSMSIHLWDPGCQHSLTYDADPPPPGALMIYRFTAPYTGDYILEVGGSPPSPRAYTAFVFCGDDLPLGACCLSSGGCFLYDRPTCIWNEGIFYGEETACDPILCPTIPPNDICDDAIDIPNPGSGHLFGTTVFAANNYDQLSTVSCTHHRSQGRDVVYRMDLADGDRVDLTYTQWNADASVYLITDCMYPWGTCVAGADDNGYGQSEVLGYVAGSPAPGACCHPDGHCAILVQAECEQDGGYWVGAWTECTPYACNLDGACCLADGSCVDSVDPWDCAALGGVFQGGYTDCRWVSCPQPAEACCFQGGVCTMQPPQNCLQSGGLFHGGECDPNPCPDRFGACCIVGSPCALLTPQECAADGGTYMGDGVTCLENPCSDPAGACCFADGTCELLTLPQCTAAGGVWYSFDSCNPNPCPSNNPKRDDPATRTYYLIVDSQVGASGGPWTLDYTITSSAGVQHDVVTEASSYLRVAPNPFFGATRIDYRLAREGPVRLDLFDASGRWVRRLHTEGREGSLSWDGTDERGAAIPSGVYFVRIAAGAVSSTCPVIKVR